MVSVIVPVYNTEAYLHRCIGSVLRSSYQDFELILVNDGSADGSAEICRAYAEKDLRVKWIGQEHKGVSAARNRGIEESRGEWIVFADSDDFIADDLTAFIEREEFQRFDLLIFDYVLLDQKGRKKGYRDADTGAPGIHYYDAADRIHLAEDLLYSRQLVKGGSTSLISPWAKAYKKSVIDQYALRFPEEIVRGEDRLFNLRYYMSLRSAAYIEKKVYFTEIRHDSLMHGFDRDYYQNDLRYQKCLKDILCRSDIFSPLKKAYYNAVLFGMADILIKGVFNPYSTRTREENYELCGVIRKNKAYMHALKYNQKTGSIPRKILLFLFCIKCDGMVNVMSKMSYRILERMEKL